MAMVVLPTSHSLPPPQCPTQSAHLHVSLLLVSEVELVEALLWGDCQDHDCLSHSAVERRLRECGILHREGGREGGDERESKGGKDHTRYMYMYMYTVQVHYI